MSKAEKQSKYTLNKIHRALKNLGYSIVKADETILSWDKLSQNNYFMTLYAQVIDLFDNDQHFQASCIEASRWVLEKRVEDTSALSPEALRSAARYLLTEIPLFTDTAGIVNQTSSVFCYHQCIPFIERLMKGHFNLQASAQQGFVVIEENNTGEHQAAPPVFNLNTPVQT